MTASSIPSVCFLSASELALAVRSRTLSPVEVTEAFLARIDSRNAEINAYVTVLADEARAAARECEAAVMAGAPLGPLHGVPVAIKDGHDTAGVRTTSGSRAFAKFVPTQDETPIARLRAAGAIVLGKTNLPEFGHKGVTDNPLFGPTSTPFAPGYNAGGSSGGSAAAVADGMAALAHGTDGGGSVRIPAAMSGVYGLVASYGRVANVTRPDAFFTGRDQFVYHGPLARSVEDAALMLSVMAGPDPRDPSSLPPDATDYLAATRRSIAGLRVAFDPTMGGFPVEERVRDIVEDAVNRLADAGATVAEAPVRFGRSHGELSAVWRRGVSVYYAHMLRYKEMTGITEPGYRDLLTDDFREYVELGERLSAVEYRADDIVRTQVVEALQEVFDDYDLLVTPTVAVAGIRNADDGYTRGPTRLDGETVDPMIGWVLTHPVNFTGRPAASVPAGWTVDGLPVGMQLVGRHGREDVVIAASAAFERVSPWSAKYVDLTDDRADLLRLAD